MTDKILEWLQKTGYPLELYGESILSELNFNIINSHMYVDFEKNINRELDLLANLSTKKEDVYLEINLLIECKKSEKPLIVLANNNFKKNHISFGEYLTINNPHCRTIMGISPEIEMPGTCSYGFKIIQAFTDGDELINKASNTLIKSYHDFNLQEAELLTVYMEGNVHSLVLPILLIDAPLFELALNDEKVMEMKEIDSCILGLRKVLPDFDEEFLIPVIKKQNLKTFCQNFNSISERIIDFLIENPNYQMKRLNTTKLTFVDKK